MKRPNNIIYLAVSCAIVAASCGSDSDKKGGGGTGASAGIIFDDGAISGGATNPPPIDPSNVNGWTDITPDTRTAMIGQGCAGGSAEPEGAPSILEFVLDVSGTMRSTTNTTNGQSKWEACAAALRAAVAGLPENIAVGFEFFPNMDNGGAGAARDRTPCIDHSDDVAPAALGPAGSAQRNALNAALDAVTPNARGATPTQDALDYAYDLLRQNTSQMNKYVVLITDGQPTLASGCYGMADPNQPDDTAPIIADIGNVYTQEGIKTFIVGSPGSEATNGNSADARGSLSAEARAGGTATAGCGDTGSPQYCHFDLSQTTDFGTALAGALNTIGQWVVGCDYTLPATSPSTGEPIDPNKVNLIYTDGTGQSHLLLPNGDPTCAVGWQYLDPPNYTQIHICGTTCSTIQNDAQASLDLVFGCMAGVPLVL